MIALRLEFSAVSSKNTKSTGPAVRCLVLIVLTVQIYCMNGKKSNLIYAKIKQSSLIPSVLKYHHSNQYEMKWKILGYKRKECFDMLYTVLIYC